MKNDLNNFLKSIALFIGLSTMGWVILSCLWGDLVPQSLQENLTYPIGGYGHMFTRLQDVKNETNIDLLIIGSSHAYRGFDTRIFEKEGIKTFNLGSSSQTPIQSELLLERYLNSLSPQIIIYEVYPGILSADGVESAIDIIANDGSDYLSFKMALNINHLKIYNTLLYGFYRDLSGRNSTFREDKRKGDDLYISGGFVQKDLQFFRFTKHASSIWSIRDDQLKSFENIIQMASDRQIKLYLIQAPITKSLYKSIINNTKFDSIMRSYTSTYRNFNNTMQLDDSLFFYDSNHLNQYGVDKFNKEVLKVILQK